MTKLRYSQPSTRRIFLQKRANPRRSSFSGLINKSIGIEKTETVPNNSGRRLKRRMARDLQENQQKKVGSRSISRVLSWTTIPLGMLLPACSSSLPGSNASHAMRFPIWPCFRSGSLKQSLYRAPRMRSNADLASEATFSFPPRATVSKAGIAATAFISPSALAKEI